LAPTSKKRVRDDGRQSLLVYMEASLIRDLKKAAIDEQCNAYEIVEAATRKWLADRSAPEVKPKKSKSLSGLLDS